MYKVKSLSCMFTVVKQVLLLFVKGIYISCEVLKYKWWYQIGYWPRGAYNLQSSISDIKVKHGYVITDAVKCSFKCQTVLLLLLKTKEKESRRNRVITYHAQQRNSNLYDGNIRLPVLNEIWMASGRCMERKCNLKQFCSLDKFMKWKLMLHLQWNHSLY